MDASKSVTSDPLLAGFFTMQDVARLLRTDNRTKLRGWLNGWTGSKTGPIIKRDFKGSSTVSFLDLMELRFIEHFRGIGVPFQTLRRAADNARIEWKKSHPFALSKAKYLSDRRNIFAKSAEEEGDEATWNLASNQYEMWEAIESAIDHGVTFDPLSDFAKSWRPMADQFPHVYVDPHHAFGAPVITDKGIPTATLFSQYRAESRRGGSERVSQCYGIDKEAVNEAVQFEIVLAA